MSSPPFINGQNDGLAGSIESFNQLSDESRTDEWMINQKKNYAIGLRGKTAQGRLNRTQLPLFPVFIDDDFIGRKIYFFGDGLGVGSQHDTPHADFWVVGYIQQMLEEGAPLEGKQRFRRSHPAGCAAREDDGCEHVTSFSVLLMPGASRSSISCAPPIPHCGERQLI